MDFMPCRFVRLMHILFGTLVCSLAVCACRSPVSEESAKLVPPTAATRSGSSTRALSMSEAGIRHRVAYGPRPPYPKESILARKAGVVVSAIVAATDGHVASVDVLEAPDPTIASAVKETLALWRLTPVKVVGATEYRPVRSNLTFYYRLTASDARVLSPEEMMAATGRTPPIAATFATGLSRSAQ